MKMHRMKYVGAIIKLGLVASFILSPAWALAEIHLRPQASATGRAVGLEAIGGSKNKTSSAGSTEGEARYFGDGSLPVKLAHGKAALISSFSAHDLVRGVRKEDIPTEKGKLRRFAADVIANIALDSNEYTSRAIPLLQECVQKVTSFLDSRAEEAGNSSVFIQDSVTQLDMEVTRRLQSARDLVETEALKLIKSKLGTFTNEFEAVLVDVKDPERLTSEEEQDLKERALSAWGRFFSLVDSRLKEYNKRIMEKTDSIKELQEIIDGNKAALEGRRATLGKIRSTEANARRRKNLEQDIEELEAQIADDTNERHELSAAADMYRSYIFMLRDAFKAVGSAQELVDSNISPYALVYKKCYLSMSAIMDAQMASKPPDDADSVGRKGRAKIVAGVNEVLGFLDDLIAHLREVEAVQCITNAEQEPLILFTDKEIVSPVLYRLNDRYDIKAIVSREGALSSHSTEVARALGIAVIVLDDGVEPVVNIVEPGDDVLVETKAESGKSYTVIRPTPFTLFDFQISDKRQEKYAKWCQSRYAGGESRSEGVEVEIYGNASGATDVSEVLRVGGDSIGLFRTELTLDHHDSATAGYAADVVNGDGGAMHAVHREMFFYQYRDEMLEWFKLFKRKPGPLTMRTLDVGDGKAEHLLESMPLGQREARFNFYRTERGREIIEVQVAALLAALYKLRADGSQFYFVPTIIIPMVKNNRDMEYFLKDVLQNAVSIAVYYIEAEQRSEELQARQSLLDILQQNVLFGPMIETVEATDALDELIANPDNRAFSVGNNDHTEAMLSHLKIRRISRNSSASRKMFFDLHPELLQIYIDLAQKLDTWNAENPDMPKSLGFCGGIAGREKFLLFALYLKKRFPRLTVYISVLPELMPQLDNFRSFVSDATLDEVFKDRIDEKIDERAQDAVDKIYRDKIYTSDGYRNAVSKPLEREREELEQAAGIITVPVAIPESLLLRQGQSLSASIEQGA
ncbi:putative PEP-binding protein [Candidatus Omnitrophota bacterium]